MNVIRIITFDFVNGLSLYNYWIKDFVNESIKFNWFLIFVLINGYGNLLDVRIILYIQIILYYNIIILYIQKIFAYDIYIMRIDVSLWILIKIIWSREENTFYEKKFILRNKMVILK